MALSEEDREALTRTLIAIGKRADAMPGGHESIKYTNSIQEMLLSSMPAIAMLVLASAQRYADKVASEQADHLAALEARLQKFEQRRR